MQPVSPPYAPPPGDPTEVLGRRFAALAIDLVFLGVIGVILIGSAKHRSFYDAPANACERVQDRGSSLCFQLGDRLYLWDRGAYSRALLLMVAAGFLDLVVLQTLMGASLGKLFVGLRVIEAPGNEARFVRMLGRWVFLIVDLGCFLVGLVTTLVTHPHRRVGDLVCGTYVVATASVGQPVLVATHPPPGFGAPPPGYAAGVPVQYPAGWGGPAGWTAPPVVTPPGTAPTTPGEWGAVARTAPPLVRSPQWQAPPPGTPQPAPEPRQSMAPQWATPPAPNSDAPKAGNAADAGEAKPEETPKPETPKPETIVSQWSPVVPLTNNEGTPLAAPVRIEPPGPAPASAVSQWSPRVPADPPNGAPPPTPPPPPALPTEPPPPAADMDEDDDVPWWET